MPSLSYPLRFVLVALAGWMNQQQRDVIDYLQEENRPLREQLGPRRLRFTASFNPNQGVVQSPVGGEFVVKRETKDVKHQLPGESCQLICADCETEVDQGDTAGFEVERRYAPRAPTIDARKTVMPRLVCDTTRDNVAAIDMS